MNTLEIPEREKECPNCGKEYQSLGKHWTSCGYPDLSDKQKDIMKGCLMGDGTIGQRDRNNPRFVLSNTNLDYAVYVYKKLQPFATLKKTEKDKLKDMYRVSVTHPYNKELSKWYNSGKKRFPNMELNSEILKHWFCCDGCKQKNGKFYRFHINAANECDRPSFIENLFSKIGFDVKMSNNDVYANVYESVDIWNYMGKPPKGMEYKWPTKY